VISPRKLTPLFQTMLVYKLEGYLAGAVYAKPAIRTPGRHPHSR
jgi:hypothetical protein